MILNEVIWKDYFVEKFAAKHQVSTDEVEFVEFNRPHVRRSQKGYVKSEDLYAAYGKTEAGRYLVVFFIRKRTAALPISAREMTDSEERYYERQAESD